MLFVAVAPQNVFGVKSIYCTPHITFFILSAVEASTNQRPDDLSIIKTSLQKTLVYSLACACAYLFGFKSRFDCTKVHDRHQIANTREILVGH